jgi:hypothetical protein
MHVIHLALSLIPSVSMKLVVTVIKAPTVIPTLVLIANVYQLTIVLAIHLVVQQMMNVVQELVSVVNANHHVILAKLLALWMITAIAHLIMNANLNSAKTTYVLLLVTQLTSMDNILINVSVLLGMNVALEIVQTTCVFPIVQVLMNMVSIQIVVTVLQVLNALQVFAIIHFVNQHVIPLKHCLTLMDVLVQLIVIAVQTIV